MLGILGWGFLCAVIVLVGVDKLGKKFLEPTELTMWRTRLFGGVCLLGCLAIIGWVISLFV